MDIRWTAWIDPAPLPRPRARVIGRGKRARATVYTPSEALAWQRQFAFYCPNIPTITEAVRVDIGLYFPRPKAVRGEDWAWKHSRPDIDNCAKMVLDAMRHLWADDAQVVLGTTLKIWADPGAAGCVVVRVRSASAFVPENIAGQLGLLPEE